MCTYIPKRRKKKREICEARHSTVTVLLLIEIYYLLVFRLGSKKFNYLELSEQIALKTGGLSVSTHLDESSFQIEDYEEVINKEISMIILLWNF
jgi:Zn-dependent M16 (insulinase) family peptidase